MNVDRLKEILESHGKWLRDEVGEKADLIEANLIEADLIEANLSEADLRRADLSGANLSGANLRGADLSEADLRRADLIEADLRRADLSGANLRGADLSGADLSEKIIQVGPIGSRKDYTIYWIDRDVVQCGCWNNYGGGSLDEFKRRIDEKYPAGQEKTLKYRNEYLAAIAMFERLRNDAGKSV